MRRKADGFSLIEMMIAIAILGIVMAMNSQLLQELLRGQRQQSVVASSQFETALALEMLRNDLSNAGFGLPDEFQNTPGSYTEATSSPAQSFNDAPNVPRAIIHNNDVSATATYMANSDYLVIKSPAMGMNSTAGKWTHINGTSVHVWNDVSLDMENGKDYMIVIKPRTALGGKSKLIVASSGTYAPQYITGALDAAFQPTATGERFLAYGVERTDNATAIKMPFNRADYYVRQNITNPSCATGTGTFIKRVFNHTGSLPESTEYPLIECAVNMQVIFRLDTNADGVPDSTVNNISGLDALTIKEQVKEVRIYILAHEGMMDRGFSYSGANPVIVGPDAATGASINLSTLVGSDWDHYRWRLYTVFVKPKSFY